MNITELLGESKRQEIINGIVQQSGVSQEKVTSIIEAASPVLIAMLSKNASTEQGAQGILGALDQHDGSILDNLSGFFKTGDTKDGNGILDHILEGNKGSLVSGLSKKTGVSNRQIGQILALLAPIILGYLGKRKSSENITTEGGLGDLLGGLLSGNNSVMGTDILGSLLGGNSSNKEKSSGLGNLLSRLLGR